MGYVDYLILEDYIGSCYGIIYHVVMNSCSFTANSGDIGSHLFLTIAPHASIFAMATVVLSKALIQTLSYSLLVPVAVDVIQPDRHALIARTKIGIGNGFKG